LSHKFKNGGIQALDRLGILITSLQHVCNCASNITQLGFNLSNLCKQCCCVATLHQSEHNLITHNTLNFKKKEKKMGVSKQRIIKYKPTNAFLKLTKAYASNPT
jgi:hypothetical protein